MSQLRILALTVIAFSVMLDGCITYYRADAFSGINPAGMSTRSTVRASYSRYTASAYFDGEDEFPHTSRESATESSYHRDEFVAEYTRDIGHHTRFVASLPASRVTQQGQTEGDWRVEHVWIGTMHMRADRRVSLLLALGVPLAGGVEGLRSPTSDQGNDTRLAAMTVVANGFEPDHWSYYLRLGAVAHLGSSSNNERVYEFQGETHVAPAIGPVHAGLRLDAKFTLVSDDSESTPLSRDAVAVGPTIHMELAKSLAFSMQYRKEVFGYFASAGSSVRVGFDAGF